MLPETLSADICSLKQGEVRAALACHLVIDKDGTLKSWRFTRAKICVAANIAYEYAQAAINEYHSRSSRAKSRDVGVAQEHPSTALGTNGGVDEVLVETALKPLWECWAALLAARTTQPLELDIPSGAWLDEKGGSCRRARERLDGHGWSGLPDRGQCRGSKALEATKAP